MSYWVELHCDARRDPKCSHNNGVTVGLSDNFTTITGAAKALNRRAKDLGWKKRDGKLTCPRCQKVPQT